MEIDNTAGDWDIAVALQASLDEDLGRKDRGGEAQQKKYHPDVSIVDDYWEYADPTPDIRELFLQFNEMFFDGLLAGCEVRWSPRMTLCAGLCVYEGYGGLCSIRLSQPLLKLRPRRDLVDTLLHEMIHALLFVTENNTDHDGHGPQFQSHMRRINERSGTNITIFHNFHNEVRVYRQHWWKCDGPCQHRPPFYGMVKRAMNRAPAPHDLWWDEHRQSCGGQFVKVKEPDGYKNKKRQKTKATNNPMSDNGALLKKKQKNPSNDSDINDYFEKLSGGHRLVNSSAVSTTMPPAAHHKKKKVSNDDRKLVTVDKAHQVNQTLCDSKEIVYVEDSDSWSLPLSAKGVANICDIDGSMFNSCSSNTNATKEAFIHTQCPACGQSVSLDTINSHLDACLGSA